MAKAKPGGGRYLADLRERVGLKPFEVLKRLRAKGLIAADPNKGRDVFSRWERGERRCPIRVQAELAAIYGVPLLDILQHTEGVEPTATAVDDATTSADTSSGASDHPQASPVESSLMPFVSRIDPDLLAAIARLPADDQSRVLEFVDDLRERRRREGRAPYERPG